MPEVVIARDGPSADALAESDEDASAAERRLRWHGSTILFDQSLTTQTVGLGADYQSANPTYEWWLALKPRYYLYETARDSVNVNLWMNLYLELTNSDTSTEKREPLLGPTYIAASGSHVLREAGRYKTTVAAGPRLTLPTDKPSWDSGQVVGLGATAEASQTVPLRGKSVRLLRGARFTAGAIYNHPFSWSTSPVDGGLHQIRQDIGGRTVVSDVLRGQMNVANSLSLLVSGELNLTRKLTLALSYVSLNSWVYGPSDVALPLPTGPAAPLGDPSAPTHRVSTWLTAALGYDVTSELTVSLGYYNLASQIGPDGQRRNPFWSPSARLFFSVQGNLDAIYLRLRPKRG